MAIDLPPCGKSALQTGLFYNLDKDDKGMMDHLSEREWKVCL